MFKLIRSLVHSMGRGIKRDPELARYRKKYPRVFRFVKNRFTSGQRFGLGLTVGTFISLFFVYLFFSVLENYIGHETLVQSDLRVINLIQIFRTLSVTRVMLFFTSLGSWQVVFAGTVLASMYLTYIKKRDYLLSLWVSVLGSQAFVWLIKTLLARPRPPLANAIVTEPSYSFPSGHTFIAFSFYGVIAYFLFRATKRKLVKALVVVCTATVILCISFSRMYLGVHWPSDVLASLASGAAWLTALITTLEIHRKYGGKKTWSTPLLRANHHVGALGLALCFILFVGFNFEARSHILVPAISETRTIISATQLAPTLFGKFPKFSETITGAPMEPINIIVIGSFEKLQQTFEKAKWLPTDPITPRTTWKMLTTSVFNKPYPQAPGTPSFWNGQPNEIAFEKSTEKNSVRERNHVHFWHTSTVTDTGARIWVGTAHMDRGVKTAFGLLPVHTIDPAIDKERDTIKSDLLNTNVIQSFSTYQIIEPSLGANSAGDPFFTDGKVYIFTLEKE